MLGLTQKDLAQQASCSLATIRKIEAGNQAPSRDLAQALVRALGVPAAQLDAIITFACTPNANAASAFVAPPLDRPAAPAQPIPLAHRAGLLTTNLYIPQAPSNRLPRPRLTECLSAGMACKLTLVAAPAGFGKTTAVSAWLDGQAEVGVTHPFVRCPALAAWVSLDAGNNDPARFWRYVICALDSLIPGLAEAPLEQLNAPQPPFDTILTGVLNALVMLSSDAVLVLDDYHVITAPKIHDRLAFLLDHLPPRLHLLITSRSEPPLPLARLRGRGQVTELRASDLRFTADEATAFLRDVMCLPLDANAVAVLETRTEGWIAGLQLAALAMREKHDLAGFLSAFSGSNRFVMDYLAEEVFMRQPSHIQKFCSRHPSWSGCAARCVMPCWGLGVGNWGSGSTIRCLTPNPEPRIPNR